MRSSPIYPAVWSVLAALALAVLLCACATRVTQTGTNLSGGGALPRPQRVLVTDFDVDPEAVRLDQGIGPRVTRLIEPDAPTGTPAREVQNAISEALVDNIRKMGLPAERALPGTPPRPNDLLVQGQILKIDQGNRTRRLVVGFGAGKSSVQAKVQIYYGRGGARPELLQTYDADANSGRKPGFGMGAASAAGGGSLAPAALSGALGVHSEQQGVAGEGQHLGDRIAYNLGEFFVQQGWISPSSAPARSLR